MTKKPGFVENLLASPLLPTALLALGAYFIVKKEGGSLFEFLGLKSSAEDKAQEKDYNTLAKTAFNPNWWKSIPSNITFQYFDESAGIDVAKKVYDCKNWLNDDEATLYGIFRKASSLSVISSLCYWFFVKYGLDLHEYLTSFLNDSELRQLYAILMLKPMYK